MSSKKKYITVEDMIKKLQALPNQKAIIATTSSNFEQNHAKLPASHLYQFKGELKNQNFRDGFDGGSYTSEVIRWDDKGKQDFVEIS